MYTAEAVVRPSFTTEDTCTFTALHILTTELTVRTIMVSYNPFSCHAAYCYVQQYDPTKQFHWK